MVPLKDTLGDGQMPSRRHSRGHTEDACSLARPNFVSASFESPEEGEHTIPGAIGATEWVSRVVEADDRNFVSGVSSALTTRSQDDV